MKKKYIQRFFIIFQGTHLLLHLFWISTQYETVHSLTITTAADLTYSLLSAMFLCYLFEMSI